MIFLSAWLGLLQGLFLKSPGRLSFGRLAARFILENMVRDQPRILYARHVEARGVDLFHLVCEQDLEGIVCKHRLVRLRERSIGQSAQSDIFAAGGPAGVVR
jgi:hypothetical protein